MNRYRTTTIASLRVLLISFVQSVVSLSAAFAQPAEVALDDKDDRVILSPFEVTSTKDKGYTSTNAATGFKTNEVLLQIPQAVTLVTRDLIDDIGYTDSSEILQFVGVSPYYKGETHSIRGVRTGLTLIDDVPDTPAYTDTAFIDSYTVLRGPTSTLYLNAGLSGTILKTTKKPLPVPQYSITGKIDSHGLWRAEVDFTGPIGSLGDMKFSYRIIGVKQGGDAYFKNKKDDRTSLHPMLQMAYKNTVVRLALDYQDLYHPHAGNNFITPEGKLYTGAGRDEGYYAPGVMESHEGTRIRLEILQKLAENWDLKISGTQWNYWRLATNVFPTGGINWPAQTITFSARANDLGEEYKTVLADVIGKYRIAGIQMQTAFGTAYSEQWGESWIRATSSFGTKTVSISNPQMNTFNVPRITTKRGEAGAGDYPVINPGSGSITYRGNAYIQQTAEVIPNRLTAVLGYTYSKIKTNRVTNLYTRTTGVQTYGEEDLHRYGLVFNITKDVVLYGMESTTFAPTTARDINNDILPNEIGTGREVGVKTALWDGRLSSTLSFFNIELSNSAFFAGVRPDGQSYYEPAGRTVQKGFDMDLAISPAPGLQFVAAYYNGTVKDRNGNLVPNTYTGSVSFFGRYEFQSDSALSGFSIGGGLARTIGRTVTTGGYVTGLTPNPSTITLEAGNMVNVFANYRLGNLTLRGSIENVLDEAIPVGAQGAFYVDPSLPRTFSFSATYKF